MLLKIFSEWIYPTVLVLFFFGLTIFAHELGHFLMARRRGMKVERFSIGFGPKIWGWTRDGVEYRVSWIPFGGYVALPQMSPAETLEGKSSTEAHQLPPASPASKITVAFAGPIMNLVLAAVLACIIWVIGMPMPTNTTVVGWVEPGSAEEQLGIQPGDRIVEVNGTTVTKWTGLLGIVAASREPKVTLVVERGGQRHEYVVDAVRNPQVGVKMVNLYPPNRPFARKVLSGSAAEQAGIKAGDRFLAVSGVPIYNAMQLRDMIGRQTDKPTEVKVMRGGAPLTLVVTPEYNAEEQKGRMGVILGDEVVRPGPKPHEQFIEVFQLMGYTVKALFHSKETGVGVRNLSGPVGIVGTWWLEVVYGGIRRGLWIAVLLNINLAVLNLLPIPVLDGGHIIFSLIEAIRRRPLNARLVHTTSMAFAVLLISFMLYVTFFDIRRFFPGSPKSGQKPETRETAPAARPSPETAPAPQP